MEYLSAELRKRFTGVQRALKLVREQVAPMFAKAAGSRPWLWWLVVLAVLVRVLVLPVVAVDASGLRLAL